MKTLFQILCLSLIGLLDGCPGLPDFDLFRVRKGDAELRDGDIIFHTSRSSQSRLIQEATGSPWSHMGVVFHIDGKPMVYEAVGPVKSTPLRNGRRGERTAAMWSSVSGIPTACSPRRILKSSARPEWHPAANPTT